MGSAARAGELAKAALTPGRAVTATLHPIEAVAYVVKPKKPGGAGSYGGLFSINVAQPGAYSVVMGSLAWVDVLDRGKSVLSAGHAHPPCSTARKVVDFSLPPGRYVLQIAGSSEPRMALLVAKRP